MKNKPGSIIYSKKGFLIEYPTLNKKYYLIMLLRFLAFLIDFGMVVAFWALLYYFAFNKENIYVPLIIPFLYCAIYQTIVPMITNGKTIGLAIMHLRIIHKSGFITSTMNIYIRGFASVLYLVPVLGQILMVLAFLATFLSRGVNFLDYFTQTIIIQDATYKKLQKIEQENKGDIMQLINIKKKGNYD